MSASRGPAPFLAFGGAAAVALVGYVLRRRTHAASLGAREVAPLLLELGRPVPHDVRALVASGWSSSRGWGDSRRLHRALDLPLAIGTPVLAVAAGQVTHVDAIGRGSAGRWIAVRHPSGLTSRYMHLAQTLVRVGQSVSTGERVGLSGDSGSPGRPHLHLDLRVPGLLLPAVAAAIGVPRTGWGPVMPPFGVSIPGEAFVPVDAYTRAVETQAEDAAIPMRRAASPRNARLAYRPVGARGDPYPAWLRAVKGESGVYVIRERDPAGEPVIVDVGQSSAGKLYETLTRHLQSWRRWKGFWRGQYGEGHDPGLTYDRASVDVAVRVLPASRALDEEARLIRTLRPRDNLIGRVPEDEVPF